MGADTAIGENSVNNHSIRPHLRIPGSIEFSPIRIQYPLSLLFSLAFLLIRFVHPSIRPSIIHFIELEKTQEKRGKKNQGKKLNTPLTGTLAVTIQNTLVSS